MHNRHLRVCLDHTRPHSEEGRISAYGPLYFFRVLWDFVFVSQIDHSCHLIERSWDIIFPCQPLTPHVHEQRDILRSVSRFLVGCDHSASPSNQWKFNNVYSVVKRSQYQTMFLFHHEFDEVAAYITDDTRKGASRSHSIRLSTLAIETHQQLKNEATSGRTRRREIFLLLHAFILMINLSSEPQTRGRG